MAFQINRTLLLVATALTAVGCQSGGAVRAMNPTAGRSVAMLQPQATEAQARQAGLAAAEGQVASSPDDVEARRTLAHAYFAAGRFHSAAQAFDDALALAPNDSSLRLKKALALLAQGNQVAAVGELDRLPPSADAGLAYALAGQPARGVALLMQAARQPEATARTRQNLALAYALDGRWAQARAIAAQDLDQPTLERRVRQWAELAATGSAATQTAGLLAITPAAGDAGRPTALAYVPPEARVRLAAAAPTPVAAEATPVVAAPKPVEVAAATPIVTTPVRPAAKASAPARKTAPAGSSPWVVQLAAYDSAAIREEQWQRLSRRSAALVGDYRPVRSEVTIGSRRFFRLALAGFEGRADAVELCETLQAKGRACFVRSGAPVALAARAAKPGRA